MFSLTKLMYPASQHKNNVIYVIDTDDYSIIKINLKNYHVKKYILPIKHIFRGLAVSDNGSVLLTGFEDKVDIRGDRTAVFEFKLNSETNETSVRVDSGSTHIEAAERLTAFFVFVEKNMEGLSDKLRANGLTKFYVTSVFNKK